MMSETEMSQKLGILLEPIENRVDFDENNLASVISIVETFREQQNQANWTKDLYVDMWLEFVPWHSDN